MAQRKEMASGFSKGPPLGLLPDVPSLMETLSYSYCYVGIMTGECVHPRPASAWTLLSGLCSCPTPTPHSSLCCSEGLLQFTAFDDTWAVSLPVFTGCIQFTAAYKTFHRESLQGQTSTLGTYKHEQVPGPSGALC